MSNPSPIPDLGLPAESALVDTHAHLCDLVFDPDREQVLEEAQSVGIHRVIAVGETLADAHRNRELCARHPQLALAAGLYPTYLDLDQCAQVVAFIREHQTQMTAIGEVGLDYWQVKEEDQRRLQRHILRRFVDLSLELSLPLNIHSRSAGRHAIALLLQAGAKQVQMHAFDGKAGAAMPGVDAGFFFSIPPSVIRSRQKQKLVRALPLDCLLIESDSPVLGPTPDERNVPAQALTALVAIARIKELDIHTVATAVAKNTHHLYSDINAI